MLEFYDDLVKFRGDSPANESSKCGIWSEDIDWSSCSSSGTSSSFDNDANEFDEGNNDKNVELTNPSQKSEKGQIQYHSLSTININILSGSSVWLRGISCL